MRKMEYCTQVACDTRPWSSRFRFCFENQQYATTTLTHAGYLILITSAMKIYCYRCLRAGDETPVPSYWLPFYPIMGHNRISQ